MVSKLVFRVNSNKHIGHTIMENLSKQISSILNENSNAVKSFDPDVFSISDYPENLKNIVTTDGRVIEDLNGLMKQHGLTFIDGVQTTAAYGKLYQKGLPFYVVVVFHFTGRDEDGNLICDRVGIYNQVNIRIMPRIASELSSFIPKNANNTSKNIPEAIASLKVFTDDSWKAIVKNLKTAMTHNDSLLGEFSTLVKVLD